VSRSIEIKAVRMCNVSHSTSCYRVHWLLEFDDGAAEQYAAGIRRRWSTYRGNVGEERMTCVSSQSVVDVGLELSADDCWHAIDETRSRIDPSLQDAGVRIPDAITVVVAPKPRFLAKYCSSKA
jgi:hypothetical protein